MNVVITPAMLGQVIISGILAGSLYAMVALGLYFSRRATKSADGYLIGERSLPWWVIGFANVSTYSDSGGSCTGTGGTFEF